MAVRSRANRDVGTQPRVRRAYFECRYGQLHVHNVMPSGGGFVMACHGEVSRFPSRVRERDHFGLFFLAFGHLSATLMSWAKGSSKPGSSSV